MLFPICLLAWRPCRQISASSYGHIFAQKKGWDLSRSHPFLVKKLSDDFIDLSLDTADPAAHRGLGHIQRLLDLHNGVRLDAQVKDAAFLACKITFPPKPFAFGLGKLGLDVQGVSPFLLDPSPLGLPLALLADSRCYPCH